MNGFPLGEVKKTSRALQIVDLFKDALANGKFKIGDKLPPERELALLLGAGRSSLREAIGILSAYGIVEARQGDGTFITDKFVENVFDFLGFTNVTNEQNYLDLMRMREIFEVGAARQICENITSGDLAALDACVRGFELAATPHEKALYDVQFHELLVSCTRNPLFVRVYKMSLKLLHSLISGLLPHEDVQDKTCRDHRRIVQALKKRDTDKCREAIARHLEHISAFIGKYHAKLKTDPKDPNSRRAES